MSELNSNIGIRIADGTYFPILQHGQPGKKRMILSPAKPSQKKAKINFYAGQGIEAVDQKPLGTLVVENIDQLPEENPDIELIFEVDSEGNFDAKAKGLSSDSSAVLSFKIDDFKSPEQEEFPDIDLDGANFSDEDFDSDQSIDFDLPLPDIRENGDSAVQLNQNNYFIEEESGKKMGRSLGTALIFFLGIVAVCLLGFLVYANFFSDSTPAVADSGQTSESTETAPTSPAETEIDDAPNISDDKPMDLPEKISPAPAKPRSAFPGSKAAGSSPSDLKIDSEGLLYTVRKGDTLWDISYSVYRNPLKYQKIAQANNIEDPDKIYAGSDIVIPK